MPTLIDDVVPPAPAFGRAVLELAVLPAVFAVGLIFPPNFWRFQVERRAGAWGAG